MTFFLPLGVDDAKVSRVPWVSIALAVACVLAFFATWVAHPDPDGDAESLAVEEAVSRFEESPSLTLDEAFAARFLDAETRAAFARMHAEAGEPDADEATQAAQAQLDAACARALAVAEAGERVPLRRYSLVPARGLSQLGLLTHMFLHYGWLHLLGNLLFFYLVGPLLEDVWGRPLFAAFYVGGGLAAGLAHFALEPGSPIMMAGASGAIAACMGAFTLRYAGRKVRIAYFIWFAFRIWRGTFPLVAWAWGGLWFANEVLSFAVFGNATGVAVMAHIGGFAFGFVVALVLAALKVEDRVLAPALAQARGELHQHPGLAQAEAALERGDRAAARTAYARALAEQPNDADALLGLGRLELADGLAAAGAARVERALGVLAGRPDPAALFHALETLGDTLPVARLRPPLAFRLGQLLEGAPEHLRGRAEALYAAAGAAGAPMAFKALLRAAELGLAQRGGAERAAEHLARAAALPAAREPAQAQALAALQARAREASGRGYGRAVELDGGSRGYGGTLERGGAAHQALDAPPTPPRIVPARIVGLSEAAVTVEVAGGQRRSLAATEVLAVAVGLLPAPPATPGAPPRQTVLTDLVVSWGGAGKGPVVLRVGAANLGLGQFYPGLPPRDAYGHFLADLLARSGANTLTDKGELQQGHYPRFDTEAALTQHYYGAAV